MGNLLSSRASGAPSLPQYSGSGSVANRDVRDGICSNTYISTNIISYHKDETLPECYAQLLQCLYPPGSGYESHRYRVPKPVQGTCTWVTEHQKYKEWSENATSGLLWLSADPGCGKSVIASFLVGYLKTQTDSIVCYFFFKDDSEEQKSAAFALRAILHQLFVQRPNLCTYAEEAFKTKGSRFAEEVDTLWDILVEATANEGCGDVICVVDALDECDEMTISPLLRRITRLPEPQPSGIPLKFLLTSRPYHRIERELGSPATTIRLKGEDEVNSITADVYRVIDEGIRKLESHWGRAGELGYLNDLLKSSADRTFLWVSLVLELLKDSWDDSPEEFTNIITTTPRDLAEFYTKILDKSANPNEARRILNIVVAAARPLTLREMNIAFKISRDHTTVTNHGYISHRFEKTVKNFCGLFVRVIDEKVYLVHQTAREFLLQGSSAGQGNWQYTLCSRDSNFLMADICITYLSLDDFENHPLPMSLYTGGSVEEDGYIEEHALLSYAATHWHGHFRDSQDWRMELFERTRLICERGSNRFLTWLKVYWENSGQYRPFPNDFTHLMIACWLGQRTVVERLSEEGGDINARSKEYGTALNIAALQSDEIVIRVLLQRGVEVYIGGRGYNISNMNRDEFTQRVNEQRQHEEESLKRFFDFDMSEEILQLVNKQRRAFMERRKQEDDVIEFLKPFCHTFRSQAPDLHKFSSQNTAFWF